jgi:hypothetical protein
VATGCWAIAMKLPGLDASVGTAEHPAPKVAIVSVPAVLGSALGVIAAVVGAAAAPVLSSLESLLPQAASEMENRVAAARAVSFVARIGSSQLPNVFFFTLVIRDEPCGGLVGN